MTFQYLYSFNLNKTTLINCYVYYCSQVRTTIMVPSGTQGRYGDMRNIMYNWITAMILRQNCGFNFFLENQAQNKVKH